MPRSRRNFPISSMFEPKTADEMAGRQRDELCIFVNLSDDVFWADERPDRGH